MTEFEQLVAMLTRAGIGHGLRHDFDPDSKAVLVESDEGEDDFTVTEWLFDKSGDLIDVSVVQN